MSKFVLVIFASILALAGCTSVSGTAPNPPSGSTTPHLYVAMFTNASNNFPGYLLVYNLPLTSGEAPSQTILATAPPPAQGTFDALADDGHKHLAVGYNEPAILIYDEPVTASSSPIATITNGADNFQGLAYDASGNLYAGALGDIVVYDAPLSSASSPSVTLTMPANSWVQQFAIHGNTLAVADCPNANGTGGIYLYSLPLTNASTPTALLNSGTGLCYAGVAFSSTGGIYAAQSNHSKIEYYTSLTTGSSPAFTIASATGIPGNLTVDGSGNLYEATSLTSAGVYRFDAPVSAASTPSVSTTQGFGALSSTIVIGR